MRTLIVSLLVVAASCTKHNPESCCTTSTQCSSFGLDGVTPCQTGRVCNTSGVCVAPQCHTSLQCTSATPLCVNQLCIASCGIDADCMGIPGKPFCASDGVCVACIGDGECAADAPVCDSTTRACRGCVRDGECPNGVCLESNGTCADQARVIFVRADGVDSGTCSATAPCLTLPFALNLLTTQRDVIHILGGTYSAGSSTIGLSLHTGYIDGSDTTVTSTASGSVFSMAGVSGGVTLSGMTITAPGSSASVSVTGGTLSLYGVHILSGAAVSDGQLDFDQSIVDARVTCMASGTLNLRTSVVRDPVTVQDCMLAVQRNHFDSASVGANALSVSGNSQFVVENNTIVSKDYFDDPMNVSGLIGSTIRFNTFVNLSGVDMMATVLICNSAVVATSNIFAWHSSGTIQCATRYSLFDQFLMPPGTGNKSADVSAFFIDMANKDLHLAPSSPAKELGEPGLPVTTDLDGNPRPLPTGTAPDVGAYEAP